MDALASEGIVLQITLFRSPSLWRITPDTHCYRMRPANHTFEQQCPLKRKSFSMPAEMTFRDFIHLLKGMVLTLSAHVSDSPLCDAGLTIMSAGNLLKKNCPLVGMSYCLTQEMGYWLERFFCLWRTGEKSQAPKKTGKNHMRRGSWRRGIP